MVRKLDRLNGSNSSGVAFQKLWQKNCETIEAAFLSLEDQLAAITAAQAAATAANAAAATANAAAATAQTAANDITSASALGSSYVSGVTITATDAGSNVTITISAHTRHYPQPDGSTVDVSVSGGSLTAQPYDTLEFVYYDDAARAGGAVTYHATTSESTAAQLGSRHTVGSVQTPLAGASDNDGLYVRPPGPDKLGNYQP